MCAARETRRGVRRVAGETATVAAGALLTALLAGCGATPSAGRPGPAPGRTTGPSKTATSATVRIPGTPPATPTTTAPPGPPYPVSQATLPLVDRSRPTVTEGRTVSPVRDLTTLVWFPDRPGRWPLIVFAHGFQVGPAPYTSMLAAWAGHGYVVAAPEFPLTDKALAGPNLDETDIDNQPADVRYVADVLASPASPLAGRIDPSRVGVAGHSDGAETALAAATAPVPGGEPAFRAVMVLSGQPVPGAPGRNPPALVVQGDQDVINPPSLGYATWDQARVPKYLLVVRGGSHLGPFQNGSSALPGLDAVQEAFLDAYVAADGPVTAIAGRVRDYPYLGLRAG